MASGSIIVPEVGDRLPATSREHIDGALATLRERAPAWTATDVGSRIAILDELIESTLEASAAWALVAAETKGIPHDSPLMGEDWGSGPAAVLSNLVRFRTTLEDILATGRPQPPALEVAPNGQVVAQVFPTDVYDKVLFAGFTAEVRLQPQVTLDQAEASMGRIYRPGAEVPPGVALVLGAGNVSSIGPMDVLYELFARGNVVLLKMNPANEHLGAHVGEAFEALVREGFLRIVYGGAEVGTYLAHHDDVDTIHMTGSDKTYEAIVFGDGDEGRARKQRGEPVLDKPIRAELGSLTPVIVVPGPWSDKDIAFQGDHIASMLVQNGGFNCVAARAIVQHRAWAKRGQLLDAVRRSLRRAEDREPYYPGAHERWTWFTSAHPTAEWFGSEDGGHVPFTLIPDLDPSVHDDIAFTTESFCALMGEVALDAPRSVPDFVDAAVDFCNETLWGTLSATILVHPRSLKDPLIAAAVERAIGDLRYGSVAVNQWSGAAYALVSPSWGAYPGSDPTDIQSGTGVVHNTYLLEDVEKSVIRGPFRPPMTPPWFHTHRTMHELLPKVTRFTATRDPKLLPGLIWSAARG